MPTVVTAKTKDEAVHILTWHDIGAIWVKGIPTVENQRETELLVINALGQYANSYGAFVIINAALPPPTYEVRTELDTIYNRLAPRLRCVAYVILGSGFQTALIRTALVGSNWVSRRPYPTSTTSDLRKGASWLYYTMPKDPERGNVDDFLGALDAFMHGEVPDTIRGKRKS